MENIQWIQIRSWHAIRTATRVPGRFLTRCGKGAEGEVFDVRPAGKSCETCLRSVLRTAGE